MRKLLVAVTTFAAILASTALVQAVSFNFSFTNEFPLGNVTGTVTGRIDGLADTGTSAATAAFITSIPEQPFGMPFYPLSASDNILAQPSLFIVSNSFTVASGLLTAVNFNAGFPVANSTTHDFFSLRLSLGCCSHANRVGDLTDLLVESRSTTFTAVSEVPLPAALPLLATGLGVLGLLGWRRKQKAQAVA
jgi:hypothetical protein